MRQIFGASVAEVSNTSLAEILGEYNGPLWSKWSRFEPLYTHVGTQARRLKISQGLKCENRLQFVETTLLFEFSF